MVFFYWLMFYTFFSFLLVFFFIVFLCCSMLFDSVYLLWEKKICPLLNEFLGIDALLRPLTSFLCVLVFVLVFFLLFTGFLPYSVEFMTNLWFVFFFSFSFWFSAFLHMISVKRFSLYAIKIGHPFVLSFFMVWIELISEFIKPFSLGIRLYANIVFGHYLLLGVWLFLNKFGFFFYGFSLFFVLFELAVFLVQSYIFAFLVSMYYFE